MNYALLPYDPGYWPRGQFGSVSVCWPGTALFVPRATAAYPKKPLFFIAF